MNIKLSLKRSSLALGLAVMPLLNGCGGGGGGGGEDFIGAAQLRMSISPHRIDTGDRAELRIDISRVHKNGISLKIRFPKELDYVPASSSLNIDDSENDITPAVNQLKGSDVYLVYYISYDDIGDNTTGTLRLELEGKRELKDGAVEVDADVDDPAIDNATEFNIDKPEFGAEQEVSIQVTE